MTITHMMPWDVLTGPSGQRCYRIDRILAGLCWAYEDISEDVTCLTMVEGKPVDSD